MIGRYSQAMPQRSERPSVHQLRFSARLGGRTHKDAREDARWPGNQGTAHRSGSRPFVFTLLPTKCTDGVDRLFEVMPAPWPLQWGGTRAGGRPASFYGAQYAFGPHG